MLKKCIKQLYHNLLYIFIGSVTSFVWPFLSYAQIDSTWKDMQLYGGQITSIAVDPKDSSTLYASSWMGDGLFKSTDAGQTWQSITGGTTALFRNYDVYDVAIDPGNPATIWIADNQFIDVSRDYGATWEKYNFASASDRFCFSVAVDPHDPEGTTVYAGTGGIQGGVNGAIYKTSDGGRTWFEVLRNADYNILDISINPNKNGEIWAVSSPYAAAEDKGVLYVSENSGLTWFKFDIYKYTDGLDYYFGYLDEILVHPENKKMIFACGLWGVFKKTDGSQKDTGWHATPVGNITRAMCISPAEPDTLYASLIYYQDEQDTRADNKFIQSTDSGETWKPPLDSPAEMISMTADPLHADCVYAGSANRGIFKTTDSGQAWQSINQGIRANTVYAADLYFDNATTILCGTLAGIYKKSATMAWQLINNAIAHAVLFKPGSKNVIYAGLDMGVHKTTDGGDSWSSLYITESTDIHYISTLEIPAGNKNTVIAGITFASNTRGEIVKITDNSTGFSNASFKSVLQTQSPVNKIAAHPTSADILFAGTGAFYGFQNPGGLFISRDGGNSWTATSLQNVVVNSIAISPENPDIMYAGCGSSGADYAGIYKSSDGGVSWEEKTSGFPDFFAVSDIQVDDTDSNVAYAAVYKGFNTDGRWLGGIYITVDGGDYWSQIGLSDYYLLAVNTYPLESTKKLLFTSAYTDSSVLSIPSSVILAGTGSGLYSTTTAGTGFISGLVIDNATGDAISDVVVSASGANARSVAGYYRLMLPAGAHTLQATCPGYVQVPGSAVTVSASQNVEYDIVMQAVKPDNCTCIACEVLPEASLRNDLNLLRNYRDRILKETPAGRYFIRHYYSLGSEIKPLLQRNPALKKRVEQLLFRAVPAVKASLTNNKFIIPESILNEGDLLLRDLEQIAPSGLREKIKRARNSLKELGLTI